jgi:hypothetical protein
LGALTELDARWTPRRSSFLYHVDPNPPAACIVAGPRPAAPTAGGGGSMRKPGTLSSCEL